MRLRDVLPQAPGANAIDGRLRHAKAAGDHRSRLAVSECRPDFANVCFDQFGAMVSNSNPISLLGDHIAAVLCRSSQEQMGDVYAQSVVARVTDEHVAVAYWPVLQFPRHSVRARLAVVLHEFPVSICADAADPYPATFNRRGPDVSEESHSHVCALGDGSTRARAALDGAGRELRYQRPAISAWPRYFSRAHSLTCRHVARVRTVWSDGRRARAERACAFNADAFNIGPFGLVHMALILPQSMR